ncbi:MAG TPA: hypothetical protein VMU65_12420 [Candidatus Saccharimonadales bacterium]|nr:hypothetical protein [Candidatus Saccharimonadales bacterium]
MTPLGIRAQVVDGEIWLDGVPTAYTEMAANIEGGWRGTRSLLAPIGLVVAPLLELAVVETTAPRVMFQAVGAVLVVSGSQSALILLATNLRGLGTVVRPGSHTHWDYFDGHPLIDPLSVPMTVEVTASEPS